MAEKLKDVADDLSSLNNNKDVSADITKIVRKSTIRSMASTLIPVPGVDIGANIYNLAKTYKEINDKLGIDSNDLSSSKVLEATVKGIGVKELAKTAAKLTIASSLKTIPLVGSLAGTVLEAGTSAGLTYTAASVYMQSLREACRQSGKKPAELSSDDILTSINNFSEKHNSDIKKIMLNTSRSFSEMGKMFASAVKKMINRTANEINKNIADNVNDNVSDKMTINDNSADIRTEKFNEDLAMKKKKAYMAAYMGGAR